MTPTSDQWVVDNLGVSEVQFIFNEQVTVPTGAAGGGLVNGLRAVVVPTDITGHAEVNLTQGPGAGSNLVTAMLDSSYGIMRSSFIA